MRKVLNRQYSSDIIFFCSIIKISFCPSHFRPRLSNRWTASSRPSKATSGGCSRSPATSKNSSRSTSCSRSSRRSILPARAQVRLLLSLRTATSFRMKLRGWWSPATASPSLRSGLSFRTKSIILDFLNYEKILKIEDGKFLLNKNRELRAHRSSETVT